MPAKTSTSKTEPAKDQNKSFTLFTSLLTTLCSMRKDESEEKVEDGVRKFLGNFGSLRNFSRENLDKHLSEDETGKLRAQLKSRAAEIEGVHDQLAGLDDESLAFDFNEAVIKVANILGIPGRNFNQIFGGSGASKKLQKQKEEEKRAEDATKTIKELHPKRLEKSEKPKSLTTATTAATATTTEQTPSGRVYSETDEEFLRPLKSKTAAVVDTKKLPKPVREVPVGPRALTFREKQKEASANSRGSTAVVKPHVSDSLEDVLPGINETPDDDICELAACYEKGIGIDKDPETAARLYKFAAGRGYANAEYHFGRCYQNGIGVEANPDEALRLYQSASQKGNIEARIRLIAGPLHLHGQASQEDVTKSISLLEPLADGANGHALAQFELGKCFEEGLKGVKKDLKRAVHYYGLAVAQKYPDACINLGALYSQGGHGIPKNPKEGFRLFKIAAEQKDFHGEYNLGVCYEEGIGVDKNIDQALICFRQAAEQGYASAQYEMGKHLETGTRTQELPKRSFGRYRSGEQTVLALPEKKEENATPQSAEDLYKLAQRCQTGSDGEIKDPVKAVALYRVLAAYNYAPALCEMGFYHGKGTGGVKKDDLLAFHYYQRAAEQDHPGGQTSLGFCYQTGMGVEKRDEEKAVKLYSLAAEKGYPEAQTSLAYCLLNGIGAEAKKDKKEAKKKAIKLYKLAVDQYHPDAIVSLGDCYQRGNAVDKNPKEAFKLYELAAKANFPTAYVRMGLCYQNGLGVDQDVQKAVYYYRLAADANSAAGLTNLGFCAEKGIGLAKDPEEAVRWYKRAAAQHYGAAQHALGRCYQNGVGVTPNPETAFRYYGDAARGGYAPGQTSLGFCFEKGVGVAKDGEQAFRNYALAAEQEDAEGESKLGYCFEHGIGTEKNIPQAIECYFKAAWKMHGRAQSSVSVLLKNGQGKPEDHKRAFQLFQHVVDQGSASEVVLRTLAFYYKNGIPGVVDKDQSRADDLFTKAIAKAAEGGNRSRFFNSSAEHKHVTQQAPGLVVRYQGRGMTRYPTGN